jgi:hypothetical protein
VATDIFNRQTDQFGGSFSSDSAFITFPNVVGLAGEFAADFGLLIQRMTTTYQQQVTRLYEVGTPAIYYVGGRTAGDSSIDRIVGPRKVQPVFYRKFGDVCQALSNTLDFAVQTGCGPGQASSAAGGLSGRASYTAYFCVITAIGLGIQAADMLINENLRLMFSSFEYSGAD